MSQEPLVTLNTVDDSWSDEFFGTGTTNCALKRLCDDSRCALVDHVRLWSVGLVRLARGWVRAQTFGHIWRTHRSERGPGRSPNASRLAWTAWTACAPLPSAPLSPLYTGPLASAPVVGETVTGGTTVSGFRVASDHLDVYDVALLGSCFLAIARPMCNVPM